MKKILTSLPAKLLLGIIVGIVIGLIVPESVLKVLVPIKNIMGQLISFIVPLIVIGFIAPSITKLGGNASVPLPKLCSASTLQMFCRPTVSCP